MLQSCFMFSRLQPQKQHKQVLRRQLSDTEEDKMFCCLSLHSCHFFPWERHNCKQKNLTDSKHSFPFSCPYMAKQSLQQLPCAAEHEGNHSVGLSACPSQCVRKALLSILSRADMQKDKKVFLPMLSVFW